MWEGVGTFEPKFTNPLPLILLRIASREISLTMDNRLLSVLFHWDCAIVEPHEN